MSTKKQRHRLPVKRGFIQPGTLEVTQNPVGSLGYAILRKNGEMLASVNFDSISSITMSTLSKIGFRYLVNSYLDADTEIDDVPEVFEEFLEDLRDGSAFEREGGFDIERFVTILGHVIGSVDEARNLVERKRSALAGQTVTIQHRDKTESEIDAFDHWVQQVRTRPEYREKARELFPERSKRGRKAKDLSSLLS